MRQSIKLLVLLVSIYCIPVIDAAARMEIHPRLSLEEEYTDNLFLDNVDEQEDWITIIEPGINLTYETRSIDVVVDYSLRYLLFKENDDDNIDDFKDVQRADARAVFFSGRPFTLTARERITREAVDDRETSSDYNDLVNRTTVYNLMITPEYRLQISPTFSLVVSYIYDRFDYVGRGNDYEEHIGNLSLVKELSSKTSLSLNYSYVKHDVNDDENFDEQVYSVGVEHQVGPRLSLATRVGYSEVEFDNGQDSNGTNVLFRADYKLTEALNLFASYDQEFDSSATNGLRDSQSTNFGLAYRKDELTANAELYWDQSDYELINREDETFGAHFDITLPLTKIFTTNLFTEYENASFEPSGEDVDRLSFGASLGYEYRRFLASLGYRYRANDSNKPAKDFDNNSITFRISMRF